LNISALIAQLKGYASPFLKRLALSLIALLSTAWCFVRAMHFSPSEHFGTVLSTFSALGCLVLALVFFVRIQSHRQWDIKTTRSIIEYSLFLLALGWIWPYMVSLADLFMDLDSESKSAIFVVVALVYCAVRLRGLISTLNQKHQAVVLHELLADPRKEAKLRNNTVTSTHESGHVMLYRCLTNIPHDVSVSIKENASSAGRVTSLILDQSISSTRLEWQMLLCLAGREAERYRYQDFSIGCSGDLNQWQLLADLYLRNGMGSLYYAAPTSEDQWRHNVKVIEDLQHQQENMLREFFSANEEALSAIETTLLEKKYLHGKPLEVLLERVVITKNMPCPTEMK
jgi:hypothetical protein